MFSLPRSFMLLYLIRVPPHQRGLYNIWRKIRHILQGEWEMEWLEAMKESINYMEDHLLEDITPDDIARQVSISSFYFQKGFKIITGMTVGTYLRNRRLYLAALDILTGNDKVIDLAYKYRYETPESFTKAFSRFHGLAPVQLKKQPHRLHVFLPLLIKISVEGGSQLHFTLEQMDSFPVIGLERTFLYDTAYDEIPPYWAWFCQKDRGMCCSQLGGSRNLGKYGICVTEEEDPISFRYLIAGDYEGDVVPEGMKVMEIPACTWVKFSCTGPLPGAFQATNTRIFNEWLPGNTRYEIALGLNIEMYTPCDTSSPDYYSEIWIPVNVK